MVCGMALVVGSIPTRGDKNIYLHLYFHLPNAKTLHSPLSAEIWRRCVLSGETPRRSWPRHQSEETKILNISFPCVGIEFTRCQSGQSHWPDWHQYLINKISISTLKPTLFRIAASEPLYDLQRQPIKWVSCQIRPYCYIPSASPRGAPPVNHLWQPWKI